VKKSFKVITSNKKGSQIQYGSASLFVGKNLPTDMRNISANKK
jgi:hypothetical protein